MKKSDLENGMIVECRNGERHIVIKDFTKKTINYYGNNDLLLDLKFGGYCSLKAYEEDLTTRINEYDIMKVYVLKYCNSKKDDLKLLWQREDNLKLIAKQLDAIRAIFKVKSCGIIGNVKKEHEITVELENGLKAEVKISDEVLEKCDKENYIFNQIHCAISQCIRHSRQNNK